MEKKVPVGCSCIACGIISATFAMIAIIGAAGLIEIPGLLFRDALLIAFIAVFMTIYGVLQMLGRS